MLITDIINILGNEFSSIYCVNRQDQYIQIYRHLNENTELDEILYLIFDYPHKHYTFKYFEV